MANLNRPGSGLQLIKQMMTKPGMLLKHLTKQQQAPVQPKDNVAPRSKFTSR
jgi:hypothetical protein